MIRGKCFIAARQYIFLAGTCCMREGSRGKEEFYVFKRFQDKF